MAALPEQFLHDRPYRFSREAPPRQHPEQPALRTQAVLTALLPESTGGAASEVELGIGRRKRLLRGESRRVFIHPLRPQFVHEARTANGPRAQSVTRECVGKGAVIEQPGRLKIHDAPLHGGCRKAPLQQSAVEFLARTCPEPDEPKRGFPATPTVTLALERLQGAGFDLLAAPQAGGDHHLKRKDDRGVVVELDGHPLRRSLGEKDGCDSHLPHICGNAQRPKDRTLHPAASVMTPTEKFARLRTEEFGDLGGAYFDAASVTALPARSRAAADAFNRARTQAHLLTAEHFAGAIEGARRACATLIGADVSEIALGPNTSFGINVAALGLDVPAGSVVLVPDREFPANVYPWMLSPRLRLERIPPTSEGFPDEDRLLERLREPDVAVVAVSSVQFTDGYAVDLERLGHACRSADVLLVVDGIQSLGQIPFDTSRVAVDVVATGGHKWLCGPFGAGFLYVRKEVQERLRPIAIGWQGLEASQQLDRVLDYGPELVRNARRYEQGTLPFQDIAALASSVGLILEADVGDIRDYLRGLTAPLRAWLHETEGVRLLSPPGGSRSSAIVSFVPPDIERVHAMLRAAGVICSMREGAIRVAPHFYNRPEEIELLLDVLDSSRRKGWR